MLEPRSNTLRRNVFERELVESLALADAIADFQFAGSPAAPSPQDAEPVAAFAISGIAAPDDPTFN